MCTTHMGAQRGLKRALDPMELEVQVVVNCHMVINWVLCKNLPEALSHLSRPGLDSKSS